MNPVKKLKKILADLVNQKSSPEELALGVAIGIFIGFSPWYGIQIYIAFLVAYLVRRANKLAIIAGAQINWIAPLYYYFEYRLGLAILRKPDLNITMETFKHLTLAKIRANLNFGMLFTIFWPLFIGSLVFGAIGAVLAYIITKRILVRERTRAAAR